MIKVVEKKRLQRESELRKNYITERDHIVFKNVQKKKYKGVNKSIILQAHNAMLKEERFNNCAN